MKILVYKHSSVITQIDDDFQKVKEYYKSDFVKQYIPNGIDIEFTIQGTDVPKQNVPLVFFTPKEEAYGTVMYLYQRGTFQDTSFGLAFHANPRLRCIYLAVDSIQDSIDYTWKSMAHEILHAITFQLVSEKNAYIPNVLDYPVGKPAYYGNENPSLADGNFSQALKLLVPYFNKKYKWFSDAEVAKYKMKPEVWQFLDKAREIANTPFTITSGLRSVAENTLAGGKSNSSHLRGLAVDLQCSDNFKRTKMLTGILEVAKTTPIFLEIAKRHLHIDLDLTIHELNQTMVELNDD